MMSALGDFEFESTPHPMAVPHFLDRLQKRLLNGERRLDYAILAVLAGVPVVASYAIGAHMSFGADCVEPTASSVRFRGYWESINWMALVVMLPAALFVLRWMTDQVLGVTRGRYPDSPVPLLSLLAEDARPAAGARLTGLALDGRNLLIVLVLAVLFHVIDMWSVMSVYVTDRLPTPGSDNDWSNFYLLADACVKVCGSAPCEAMPRIDKTTNLLFMLTAYLSQILIFTIGTMAVVLFLRHNILYLRLIYQRSTADGGGQGARIVLDFDDSSRSFGLRPLHTTFNLQIVCLVIAGAFVLVSRFAHIAGAADQEMQAFLTGLESLVKDFSFVRMEAMNLDVSALFPTWGQVLMSLVWFAGFLVALLPSMAKYKPFLSRRVRRDGMSIVSYLREFIPPQDEAGRNPLTTDEEVSEVAAKFARSSFWPSGDEFAKMVFYFVFFVLIMVIFPVGLGELMGFWSVLLIAAIAVVASHLMLRILRFALALVDRRLVD